MKIGVSDCMDSAVSSVLGRWVMMDGRRSFAPTLELIDQVRLEQEGLRRTRSDGDIPRHILTQILSEESARSGISIAAIMGFNRTRHVFRARMACYVRLRELHFSLTEIGLAMGGRDHTTILSGLRRAGVMAPAGAHTAEARR